MTSITFKLPPSLKKDLEEEAAKDGRSVSDFIRRHFQKRGSAQPVTTPTKTKEVRRG